MINFSIKPKIFLSKIRKLFYMEAHMKLKLEEEKIFYLNLNELSYQWQNTS